MKYPLMCLFTSLVCLVGCERAAPKADFATPEGAIRMLEDAYRKRDIEAAVAAKDFLAESRVMLGRLKSGVGTDAEVLKKSAEVMELAFRAEMKNKGFPDFTGIKSRFVRTERYQNFDDIIAVTEVCTFPDGGTSTQKLLVANTAGGWRVLNVVK